MYFGTTRVRPLPVMTEPASMILYPVLDGGGQGISLNSGVINVVDNINTGKWAWSPAGGTFNVAACDYPIMMVGALQQFPYYDYAPSIAAVRANCPCTKIYGFMRWDLWYLRNIGSASPPLIPSETLAALTGTPTAAMNEQPRSLVFAEPGGLSWADAVTMLNTAGYNWDTQTSTVASGNVTNPYWITLDRVANEFTVPAAQMNIANNDWLEKITDYGAFVVDKYGLDGVVLYPVKMQYHRTGANVAQTNQFHNWLTDTTGITYGVCEQQGNTCQPCDGGGCVPWDINTDTGGPKGAWGTSPRESFDDRVATIYDLIKSTFQMCRLMKQKTCKEVIFMEKNLDDQTRGGGVHWKQFQDEYVAVHGGTNADARQWWWDEQEAMASEMDGMILDFDDVDAASGAGYEPHKPTPTWFEDTLSTNCSTAIEQPAYPQIY